MEGKTPNKEEEAAEKKAVPEASQPDVDPILMRRQQLQQQYQQINGRIMELRQQEDLVKNMITAATIQAAEFCLGVKEITPQKG